MIIGLILAKSHSDRLPNKNSLEFCGKPMFLWNVEKCVSIFDKTYVSSDSYEILKIAKKAGALPIKRTPELCGDTPNIPVYRHAVSKMEQIPEAIIAVQANSPTIDKTLIFTAKKLLKNKNSKHKEIITLHQDRSIYGSIWGMTIERLNEYKSFYTPTPDITLIDNSIDIHNIFDLKEAETQWLSIHQ